MKYRVNNFQGIRPRVTPRLLDGQQAVLAENCDLQSGAMTPIQEPSIADAIADYPARGLYYYEGQYLTWTNRASICRSPISDDRYRRIYTADGIRPKVLGMSGTTRKEFTLGIPRPDSPPTVQSIAKSWELPRSKVFFFYEEAGGDRKDEGQVDPNYVTETRYGVGVESGRPVVEVRVQTIAIAPRLTASASSQLVLYIEQVDTAGASLGYAYTPNSRYTLNNTLVINGYTVTLNAIEVISASGLTKTALKYDGAFWTGGTTGSGVTTTERYYVYTYVTVFGEEGPPSPVSKLLSISSDQNASVGGFSTLPEYDNIEYIRIYRTVSGTAGVTTYRYVADVGIGYGTFTDQRGDTNTGEELASTGWDPPPSDLVGIRMHPGGFMVGYAASTPRTIRFSVPNHPHAWRAADTLTTDYDIVGFGISGNSIVVCTEGPPYLLTGSSPDSMSKITIPVPQSCTSGAGIVEHESLVIYPSPDGLVAVDGGSARLITSEYYSREQWQELRPETMLGGIYDNRYHGFAEGGNIVFGLTEGKSAITTTTLPATAIYNDPERDLLVLASGAQILTWRTGTARMTARWRGRLIDLQHPWNYSVARVTAAGYPLKLLLYMDGQMVYEETIEDDIAFRLPVFGDAKNWQMEIQAAHTVYEVILSTSMTEL